MSVADLAAATQGAASTWPSKEKKHTKKAKKSKKRKANKASRPVVQLTPEEQQRYDYFLLEAVRQEYLKHYDVTFALLQHAPSIPMLHRPTTACRSTTFTSSSPSRPSSACSRP